MEIITRKRTVWLTFLDVLYKKKLPLQSIHAKGVPFFVTPVRFKRTTFRTGISLIIWQNTVPINLLQISKNID